MRTRDEFKSYVAVWIICVAVFNVLVFIFKQATIGDRITEVVTYFSDGTTGVREVFKQEFLNLLIGYIFVVLAFIGQLVCTKIFLSQDSLKKTLYHYPIFSISLSGLVITLIFAIVFCLINLAPAVTFVILILTLSYTVIRCIAAKTASNMVSAKDENVEIKTQYIKVLRSETESLLSRVKDAKEKELVKKVADAVRFSDPLSIPELVDVETKLIAQLQSIKDIVNAGKTEELSNICEEFLNLISDRNAKVKSLKK